MKKIVLLLGIMLNFELIAKDSQLNEAEKIVLKYKKKINDNNGSISIGRGAYLQNLFYRNNELNFKVLFKKNEVIKFIEKSMNKNYADAIKISKSRMYLDFFLKNENDTNIVKYCNNSIDEMKQLIENGMKLSKQIYWDDGTEFMNYSFSQKTCNRLDIKRKTLYTVGSYMFKSKSLEETEKKYLKAKKSNIKPHDIRKIHGISLMSSNKIHVKILEGKDRYFFVKLDNNEYVAVEILEGFHAKKALEEVEKNNTKNIANNEKCIKFYGKKKFHGMQELDILMNDRGNALKQCQKDINK